MSTRVGRTPAVAAAIEAGERQAERMRDAAQLLDGEYLERYRAEVSKTNADWEAEDRLLWRSHKAALRETNARRRRATPRRRGAGRPRAHAARSSSRSGDSGSDDDGPSSRAPRAIWRSPHELNGNGNAITSERRRPWASARADVERRNAEETLRERLDALAERLRAKGGVG